MAKKVYAVRVGREVGLFEKWDDCKKQVQGYSGAEYKGFKSREAAYQWLTKEESQCLEPDSPEANLSQGEMVAYVDGSFDGQRYSYGAVLLTADEEIHLGEAFDDCEAVALHNVAGEVAGACSAMEAAQAAGMKKLTLVHDYSGIAFWANDTWKANLPLTKAYQNYSREVAQNIALSFVKVKSHSGNFYNDLADELAKQALSPGVLPIHKIKNR